MVDDFFRATAEGGETEAGMASRPAAGDESFDVLVPPAPPPFASLASDPYGENLFAASLEVMNRSAFDASEEGARASGAWSAALPKFPAREWDAARRVAAILPALRSPQLTEDVLETLARLTRTSLETDNWTLELLEVSETDLDAALLPNPPEHTAGAVFSVEPAASQTAEDTRPVALACTCDALFARYLISLLTRDGEIEEPDWRKAPPWLDEMITPLSVRSFSVVELAVLEFILLQLAERVNASVEAPLIKLEKLVAPPPAVGATEMKISAATKIETAPDKQRGLIASFLVGVRERQAIVRLLLPLAVLEALDARLNPLWRKGRRWWQSAHHRRPPVVAVIPGAVLVGETEVTLADLDDLKAGDAIVFDQTPLAPDRSAADARLRLGAGRRTFVGGRLAHPASIDTADAESSGAPEKSRSYQLVVTSADVTGPDLLIEDEEMPTYEASESGEDQPAEEMPSSGRVEEVKRSLSVRIRAELETRNFTLDELIDLHPGQVLDLGCRPTDPVNLMTDAGRVARGELIEIDGRLGILLSQIYQ